jgi:hypothetical protein
MLSGLLGIEAIHLRIVGGATQPFSKKRFFAKAFPEPDLKYRSRLRAVTSSVTATYDRRTTGRYLLVETSVPADEI